MLRLLISLLAFSSFTVAMPAMAQPYPNKALRMVVPFPPGGPTDVLGRVLAQGLQDAWKQTVVVENKAGAAGNIGVDAIAKSSPDGYTMGVVPAGNIAVNPTLFPNLPYKAADLAPVAMLATVENVLVINADVPAKSLKDLLALASSKPGTLSFASPGAGSQAHLAGELLQIAGGVKLIHVPYKGTGPALNDLLGGQVSMMFAQLSSALPHIKSGKLRALAVTSAKRLPGFEDIAAVSETYPGYEAIGWFQIFVPTGTPPALVERLNREINKVTQAPEFTARMADFGVYPRQDSLVAAKEFFASQQKATKKLVTDLGVQPQ